MTVTRIYVCEMLIDQQEYRRLTDIPSHCFLLFRTLSLSFIVCQFISFPHACTVSLFLLLSLSVTHSKNPEYFNDFRACTWKELSENHFTIIIQTSAFIFHFPFFHSISFFLYCTLHLILLHFIKYTSFEMVFFSLVFIYN